MRRTAIFDIIGTCFTFAPIRARLAVMKAPPLVFDLWFAQTLRDAFALSHSGGYVQLREVFAAELPRTLRMAGVESTSPDRAELVSLLGQMPPQPGLGDATARLGQAGWKVIALTQGAVETTHSLLAAAGVEANFAEVLSADLVRRTKPHPDVYQLALEAADGESWMVAAHAWDIAGAARAGMRTVFVGVDEAEYLPDVYPRPDLIAANLGEVADRLIALS
ncbi:MAG: HAD hydrolase-like protein [Candidatus Dormibacteraeota bacterium]|nr:HAD hydrolase-like protein [Candidatus Dormibacteraeota bacterium]